MAGYDNILAVVKVSLALVSTLQVVAADFLDEVVKSSSLRSIGIDLNTIGWIIARQSLAESDYIVVQQPGDECEAGLQILGSQPIDVEQSRPGIRLHAVLDLLHGDGVRPEVSDALSSGVRREL